MINGINEWHHRNVTASGAFLAFLRLVTFHSNQGLCFKDMLAMSQLYVTKRCKTLSGHNVVEGKDFKNTA